MFHSKSGPRGGASYASHAIRQAVFGSIAVSLQFASMGSIPAFAEDASSGSRMVAIGTDGAKKRTDGESASTMGAGWRARRPMNRWRVLEGFSSEREQKSRRGGTGRAGILLEQSTFD
jgi:hypothetical protein